MEIFLKYIIVILITAVLELKWTSGKITNEEIVSVTTVEAVAGGIAKLPCDTHPPLTADKVHLVIWYKEATDSPIYSYDIRSKTADQATHWSNNTFLGGRAFFLASDSPAKLTLESVKDEDGGVYRCRVDFKKSPTRNTQVNLTVIIPPEKLSVIDEKGDHIQHYHLGPYNEGSSVNITCISTGGRPLPKVTWWQENALLDESYENLSERRVRNVVHLEHLERTHLHRVYTCQATNNNHITPISSSVTLELNLGPLWVKLLSERKPLSSDQSYEVSCEVVGARPQPLISWWKGSVELKNTRETYPDPNTTISTLTFVPTMEDSGKTLMCKASTPAVENSELRDSWDLNVYHVPLVILELGSNLNASTIREGIGVYFECNIKSNPWVYRVSWRHNGKTLYNNLSGGIIVSNQSLVLQNVSRARAGIYTCVGSNQEGDGVSNPVYLDVKFAPVCRPGQQRVIGVARQETARILCEVEANPPDVTFSWKFNNTGSDPIDIPTAEFSVDKTRSIEPYTPQHEHDYGSLLCWAKNEFGTQKEPCVYHIIPAGKPDGLSNCTIINQTADSLNVECFEGFDGGLSQKFVMEVYDAQTQLLVSNVTARTPWFMVTGLSSGAGFHIALYAINSKGKSDVLILNAYTLKSAARRTASLPVVLELTPLLGMLTGAVASLILLALVIVLVLKLRGKDCEEKQHNKINNVNIKMSNESMDSLEKNPDIIPHNNEYQDPDEKAFERLNSRLYPTHITLMDPNKPPKEEITYAELQLPSALYSSLVTSGPPHQDECTVYAQIDSSMCHVTAETPLISHTRESTMTVLDRSHDSQPPSVSATRF